MKLRFATAVLPTMLLLAGQVRAQDSVAAAGTAASSVTLAPPATAPQVAAPSAEAPSAPVAPTAPGEAALPAAPQVAAPSAEAPSAPVAPTAPGEAALPAAPQVAAAPAEPPITTASGTIPSPPDGKGLVVFYRSSFIGLAIPCTVHDGQTDISRLAYGKYFTVAAEPGKHTYMVKSEAHDFLPMEVEAGETYFVKCSIAMGIMVGRPNLSPSDKASFVKSAPHLKLEGPLVVAASATPAPVSAGVAPVAAPPPVTPTAPPAPTASTPAST